MGQHKHNPTAIAAAKGELPPKPKKMGKRERDRLLYAKCAEILYKPLVDAYVKAQTEEYADKCLNDSAKE
jgi:hypothetical protein